MCQALPCLRLTTHGTPDDGIVETLVTNLAVVKPDPAYANDGEAVAHGTESRRCCSHSVSWVGIERRVIENWGRCWWTKRMGVDSVGQGFLILPRSSPHLRRNAASFSPAAVTLGRKISWLDIG
jgi:hypothetical protein